ncbi:hypothetical protein L7F22_065889 [Adiantum nelumboides]|nr:hypothetical protein [Adiantum nelumboides]
MLDLPFCSGEYGVQVTDAFACTSIRTTENVVTCLYRIKIRGMLPLVTITWCKALVGLGVSLNLQDNSCDNVPSKTDMKPWLFSKKRGSKTLDVGLNTKIDVSWDLSRAKYGSSPEPVDSFFFAIAYDSEIVLLLGDMREEAFSKMQAKSYCVDNTMISRREHIFGRRYYSTKAQFGENGRTHDILIECNTRGKEPRLSVKVDKQLVVQVKRLMWKFRGNQTILVDGCPVELFWDVHNWLFSPSDGHAVFMFQTSLPADKSWSSVASSTSLFEWHHTSNSSSSAKDTDSSGFSLLLYAWKSD